jgi:hypothetical protein
VRVQRASAAYPSAAASLRRSGLSRSLAVGNQGFWLTNSSQSGFSNRISDRPLRVRYAPQLYRIRQHRCCAAASLLDACFKGQMADAEFQVRDRRALFLGRSSLGIRLVRFWRFGLMRDSVMLACHR